MYVRGRETWAREPTTYGPEPLLLSFSRCGGWGPRDFHRMRVEIHQHWCVSFANHPYPPWCVDPSPFCFSFFFGPSSAGSTVVETRTRHRQACVPAFFGWLCWTGLALQIRASSPQSIHSCDDSIRRQLARLRLELCRSSDIGDAGLIPSGTS